MAPFGKRGLPPAPVRQDQARARIDVVESSNNDVDDSYTLNVLKKVRLFARWGMVVYLLSICAFGLVMTVMPFAALKFWGENSWFQSFTSFALFAILPFPILFAVSGSISNIYFENRRYKERVKEGKNPWPLYLACGGAGLIVFLIFSSESPLGFVGSNVAASEAEPIGMTIATYIGIGLLLARGLDYLGIGVKDD